MGFRWKLTGPFKRAGRSRTTRRQRSLLFAPLVVALLASQQRCGAQTPPETGRELAPVTLRPNVQLAQRGDPGVPAPGVIPTDVTPVGVGQERDLVEPGFRFRLFQRLPERLWFNAVTEVSQRLDTNVFFTVSNPEPDYVFRVLPNVTLGYNLFHRFSIYSNYFVIKDLFADHAAVLNFPTTQSLSLGFRQDVPISQRTNLQLDFQARELWQTSHLNQADLLPTINLTHVITPNIVGFGSFILQMRSRDYFLGATRELDPFYTLGLLWRRGSWTFVASDTLVTNFRDPPFRGSIPKNGNVAMIADFEVSRPVYRRYPGLQMFMRIEPIFNWSSHGAPGLSGIDYRMFGGLRLSLSKPSYAGSIEKLRKQLMESEGSTAPGGKP